MNQIKSFKYEILCLPMGAVRIIAVMLQVTEWTHTLKTLRSVLFLVTLKGASLHHLT